MSISLGFALGLLGGWATAFMIHAVIGRAYLADLRRLNEKARLDPLWRLAREQGREMSITLSERPGGPRAEVNHADEKFGPWPGGES